jgi:hypothetical protein
MKTWIVKFILPFFLISMACNLLNPKPAQDVHTEELQNGTLNPVTVISREDQEMNCMQLGLPSTPAEADSRGAGTGFEKAIIIINGRVTFANELLQARFSRSSSVFFRWNENMLSHFNPGVISNLLSEMVAGHPSEKAYVEVCESSGCVDTVGKGAKLLRLAGGDDLRIREVAVSLHPLTGDPLTDGDKVPVYGYPGDRKVDELPFYI